MANLPRRRLHRAAFRYRLHQSFLLRSGAVLGLVLLPALAIARDFILAPMSLASPSLLATAAFEIWTVSMLLIFSSLFFEDRAYGRGDTSSAKEPVPCAK